MNLKIMTYNIHRGTDKFGAYRLDDAIGFLSKSDADLIGLQEVDRFAKRTAFEDQYEKIKQSLSYNAVFAPSLVLPSEDSENKREYGLICMSRFPVMETRTNFLRKSEYLGKWFTESRICLETVVNAGGKKIAFLNLHIDTNEMEKQIRNLSQILERINLPKILLGDFNVPPENENIKLLQEKLNIKNASAGKKIFTHEDDRGRQQIDYVFLSEEFRIKSAEVLNIDFSDHKPLIVEVSI